MMQHVHMAGVVHQKLELFHPAQFAVTIATATDPIATASVATATCSVDASTVSATTATVSVPTATIIVVGTTTVAFVIARHNHRVHRCLLLVALLPFTEGATFQCRQSLQDC